jgi:hypothetical protein
MATIQEIGTQWGQLVSPVREAFLGACLVAAYQIVNEAPETENHANRLAWAQVILSGDDAAVLAKVLAMVRYALASNATFQADPRGTCVESGQFIVNSQVDILA